jgi:cytochrome c oxidase subunit III
MNSAQASREMKLMQNSVAMTVTLISFAMLFATLFLGYFLVRFNSPVWPPVEIEGLPQALPLLSTLTMAFSSFAYFLLEKRSGKKKELWLLTFALGIGFLVLQWMLWQELQERGILISNGMVPSMVYAFTWLHAGHIVLGLIALAWVGFLIYQRPQELTEIKLINIGKFWHFLGIVWLLMYLMMFVL